MSEKRKDHKGRILKTGESQRKDLRYQYRYVDPLGRRHTIYASTLKELREKEDDIQSQLNSGLDYCGGAVPVIELVERHVSLKQGVRYNTRKVYNFILNLLKKDPFGQRQVRDIRVSDAQLWILKLYSEGRSYSTISAIRSLVRAAFQRAYDEEIIAKNPFAFKLSDIISNNAEKRIAMTREQQDLFMTFIREDPTYSKYYDEYVVLLGTGMRVSEFCGLTKKDLDFKNRKICVDHQLMREHGGRYYIEKTKTESGCRYIPMTDAVYQSLTNILQSRQEGKTEFIVDGYSGFILLGKNGMPKVALQIECPLQKALKKYNKLHPEQPLPHITPHVFRHTFCTNMANAGMDVKALQYLMGHSKADVTLNVYTHVNYAHAAEEMVKILQFKEKISDATDSQIG